VDETSCSRDWTRRYCSLHDPNDGGSRGRVHERRGAGGRAFGSGTNGLTQRLLDLDR
jgi:hypothetical protein